jgi:two-component system sensor histidine kinase DesK
MKFLPKHSGTGRLPYAWLAFLGFFIVGMFEPPITMTKTSANVAALVVFLILFFRAFWIDDRRNLLLACSVFALLGIGLSLINPGSAVFFHYASFFAGRLGRWQTSAAVVVAILLIIVGVWYIRDLSVQYLLTAGLVSAALGGMSIQIFSTEKIHQRLAHSEAEVKQLATIAERERIARDLHDIVGHTLSVITLKSELAQRLFVIDPDKSKQEMNDIEDISRSALDEVRRTITGYRHIGIQEEISSIHKSLRAANIETHVVPPTERLVISAEQESTLIMVVKESVTNVIRHSKARNCTIGLDTVGTTITLTVHDDGVGYRHNAGTGVIGMKERIVALGGNISIADDDGTLVTVRLPQAQT